MVKKIGVEGLTSLALTPHAVFTSSKGWGGGGGGGGGRRDSLPFTPLPSK